MRALTAAVALALLTPLVPVAAAQGALSNQGFGYPTGQLSGAARGAGGATVETDPNSPINPAAVTQSSRYSVLMQFEPEFRRTAIGGSAATAKIPRFPQFSASGAFRRFAYAASVSTFLDRSWENAYADSVLVDGQWTESTVHTRSNGAIGDARLALGYVVHRRLQVGVGLHAFSGENRVSFLRTFPDTSGITGVAQASSVTYVGRALSLGLVARPLDGVVVGVSTRVGGRLGADQAGGSVGGDASVPSRTGIGISWLALPGASLNARFDRTKWTEMDALGSADVVTFDADEIGLGVDVLGPAFGGVNSIVRLGAKSRTLPFGVNGDQVSELAFSTGLGVPVARGRAQLDFALERAGRRAAGGTERGWFISVGLGIRP
ncbi:MAG: hypothetical protein WD771_09430 [Gemmatimonadaceae bacterium]